MHPPPTKTTTKTQKALQTALLLALGLLLLAFVGSCAGENTAEVATGAGFWRGLAHGVIAPFSFVVSLFRDDVSLYEVENCGGWYDFGFLVGVGVWHGGGHAGRTRWRRSRRIDVRDGRDDA